MESKKEISNKPIDIRGKAIIVVGRPGMGKTTTVKQMLQNIHPESRLVYDVNAEYTDLYDKEFQEFDDFLIDTTYKTDAFIVFEEATIFLGHNNNTQTIRELLVRRRHTRNTIVFVFHSLRTVPRFIFDMCNYVIIFKTNDTPKLVQKNFDSEEFTAAFLEIKNAPMLKDKKSGKEYSPQKLFIIN